MNSFPYILFIYFPVGVQLGPERLSAFLQTLYKKPLISYEISG